MKHETTIQDLVGLIFESVTGEVGGEELVFTSVDGRTFKFCHDQDCCERVEIESIVGNLEDLVGEPLLRAEEARHEDDNPPDVKVPEYQDSFTWTFYKFATRKGYVDVRWYGQSNGYYSERVDLYEVT